MIQLLPFTIEDSLELISTIKDKRMLLQFAGPAYHFPLTKEQLEIDLKNENRFMFRVFDETEKKVIGHARFFSKKILFCWEES
ncbi:hypothetical protein BN1195_01103 [Chryseobacterium oranimense G311]|uniref:hypothetical protein n=1 Tax=Chryseobacterium oranimense TaxID=421058 RepID=UPI000533B12B|nr:hypothetical protein [Chryseobacterium oranimense]CEJ68812.1 hypothetical protein BN1195_01103 [Chryseobacterium oranimense G311]